MWHRQWYFQATLMGHEIKWVETTYFQNGIDQNRKHARVASIIRLSTFGGTFLKVYIDEWAVEWVAV